MSDKFITLFLDIKSAYDNNPPILFDVINSLRIPVGYKIFIRNLLNYRIVDIYELGKFQRFKTLYKGLPQGSVSPLLFIC